MVPRRFFLATLLVLIAFSWVSAMRADTFAIEIKATRIMDLSHPMYDGMPYWPGGVPFRKIRMVDYRDGFRYHRFEMGENTGTHVDAPSHFVPGKRDIDQIPIRDLLVPAVVIDVRDKVAKNHDYQLRATDIRVWEAAHGRIPAGSLVLLNTGWHERFSDPARYANIDENRVMHFPCYGKDSAELLLNRNVVGIGIDTLSIDPGASTDFAVHHVMLKANKYQIENLANLGALPASGAIVFVGVLNVKAGSQAQARIIALLP